jgi:hypothetical protein
LAFHCWIISFYWRMLSNKAFQKEHYMHIDLICYQASIYCRVLIKWCQMFGVHFNVNHPMVGG